MHACAGPCRARGASARCRASSGIAARGAATQRTAMTVALLIEVTTGAAEIHMIRCIVSYDSSWLRALYIYMPACILIVTHACVLEC